MSFGGPDSPCLKCSERHPLCHSTCENYISFKERLEEIRKAKFKEGFIEDAIRSIRSNRSKSDASSGSYMRSLNRSKKGV